jgi:hypothetical protein
VQDSYPVVIYETVMSISEPEVPLTSTAADRNSSDPRVIVVTQPAAKEAPRESKTFEHIVNLVKALVWPLMIVMFFLVYRDTATQIADQVPTLLTHATKFSAGGLAIEIKEQAQQAGGAQLSNIVTSLDGEDIQEILRIGCGPWGLIGTGRPNTYSIPIGLQRDVLLKLESRKIIQFTVHDMPTTLKAIEKNLSKFPSPADDSYTSSANKELHFFISTESREDPNSILGADYALTNLGRDAFNSVLAAITAQLPGNKSNRPIGCPTGKDVHS